MLPPRARRPLKKLAASSWHFPPSLVRSSFPGAIVLHWLNHERRDLDAVRFAALIEAEGGQSLRSRQLRVAHQDFFLVGQRCRRRKNGGPARAAPWAGPMTRLAGPTSSRRRPGDGGGPPSPRRRFQ